MSKKPSLRSSYDVIVVGSGAAGCSAAISAHLNGAKRVLVAEKSSRMVGYVTIYSALKNTKKDLVPHSLYMCIVHHTPTNTEVRRDWREEDGFGYRTIRFL